MDILNEPKIIPMHIGNRTIRFGTRSFIMGILNVTPDSFSDGGNFNQFERAMAHARQMVSDGATLIDIGGESTRHKHQKQRQGRGDHGYQQNRAANGLPHRQPLGR